MSRVEQTRWRSVPHLARRALPVFLIVAAVAGLAIGARVWFHTRDATDGTNAALDRTEAELSRTQDELDAVNAQVAAARRTLDGDQWTLGVREDERDAAQEELDNTSALLTDLQAQLDAATAQLDDDTARLDALQHCLTGVAEALNQASVGDTDGMAATLDGVEGPCGQAGVTL